MNKCKSILSLFDICCSIRKLVVLGERRELYCSLWWGYVLGCVSFSRARIILSRGLFLSPLVEYAGTGSRSLANDRRPGCTLERGTICLSCGFHKILETQARRTHTHGPFRFQIYVLTIPPLLAKLVPSSVHNSLYSCIYNWLIINIYLVLLPR